MKTFKLRKNVYQQKVNVVVLQRISNVNFYLSLCLIVKSKHQIKQNVQAYLRRIGDLIMKHVIICWAKISIREFCVDSFFKQLRPLWLLRVSLV